jgi:outer membrane protein
MKSKFVLVVIVGSILSGMLPAWSSAEPDGILSLYRSAQAKDPSLGRARARVDSSVAEAEMALAVLLPRLDASAGISWINNTTVNYGTGDIHGSYTGNNYGINLRQPLVQLPGVYGLSASRAGVRAAEATLSGAEQELIVRIAEAYFMILKSRTDESLFAEERKRLERVVEQAEAFLKSGTGDVIAVYEAKSRYDSSQADLVKAVNQRRLAQQHLASLVGRPVADVKELGSYEPTGPEPADLRWWLDTMWRNQPNLIQARETLDQAIDQKKAAMAGHAPVLQAIGGYNVNKGSTFLPDVETRQWSIGLNLSFPLYSGGETMARSRRAVAAETEQRHVLDATNEQLTQKLKEAFLTLEYNASLVKALRQKQVSAEQQLTAVTKGRAIGTRTAVDLLNAEQGYAVSRRDLSGAIYDNVFQRLQLKAAAGNLNEQDVAALEASLMVRPAASPVTQQ